jgi:hypothetical protein
VRRKWEEVGRLGICSLLACLIINKKRDGPISEKKTVFADFLRGKSEISLETSQPDRDD